jgi:colanic acid biosynthesis glycosyl transferase WcaI
MNTKRVLLIGGNFHPEPTGIGKYNGEMIDWLTRHEYDCTVVTTYPYYPHWKTQSPYTKRRFWYSKEMRVIGPGNTDCIKVHRCPHYVPERPSARKRILSDLSFSFTSLFKVLQLLLKKKYDIVLVVAPPFHLGFLAILYKRFRNAKFLYHVQDLQIEAARDLHMIKSRRILRSLFEMEGYIMANADMISSISEGMIRKITDKSQKKVHLFPNWSNMELFYPIADKGPLKKQFGFNPDHKIILYSGAIGEKQGLHCIIESAYALRHQPHVRFIICGTGPYKEKLVQLAGDLDNVIFLPLQPLDEFNEFLNMADVHLVLQKARASDLVMPSKMANILAVGGLSIVTAEPGSSLYDMVENHQIGLLAPSEEAASLSEIIEKALSQDHSDIHRNSRKYAEDFLSIDGILSRYFDAALNGDHQPLTAPGITVKTTKA